jgi:hypothetical protein
MPRVANPVSGKQTLLQTHAVGDEYVDQEGICEAKPPGMPACFLPNRKRDKLIAKLFQHVQTAQTNYKLALVELKIAELLKKEEDLSWVLSLALDLVGAHFAVVLAGALKRVQAAGVSKITELQLLEGAADAYSDKSWLSRTDALLARVTPARIDMVTKAGMTAASASVKKVGHAATNVATETAKAASISYIDQLRDNCDVAFDGFVSHVAATNADAELIVVFEGLKPQYHSIGAYKASLGDKIERFRNCGVLETWTQGDRR